MRETEEYRIQEINKNPDFMLCGIRISDMLYNEENGLFFLEKGICRITSGHLLTAIRSSGYKKHLEREIDLRGGIRYGKNKR